jgi:hypothetical protein
VDSVKYAKAATSNGWLDAGMRAGEDIVLTNVISFDIKVWNPDTNSFVDLGNGSNGAFGSQGRYSGGTREDEILVQRVFFDENSDRAKYIRDPNDPNEWIENPDYHEISSDYPQKYLYREDINGNLLQLSIDEPLSPITSSTQATPPTSTLVLSAWGSNDDDDNVVPNPVKVPRMSRVFDTWTKWYESQPRNGGKLYEADSNTVLNLASDETRPAAKTSRIGVKHGNINVTGAEFFLVTFGFEPLLQSDPTGQTNRWYYEHSPNKYQYMSGDPPTLTTEYPADKHFETYSHPGTGVILNDRQSGKYWENPPPYDEVLRGVEITIRCFDPKSGNIRQVRIVKHVDL